MRPCLDRLTRQILPLLFIGTPVCLAADQPVLNELNTVIEEPLVNLPEVEDTSPFRSVSRPRTIAPSGETDELISLVEEAIDSTRRRLLDTDINSPWQIMHGMLALRHQFEIRMDGEISSGLDWISSGPTYEGESWFEKTPYGGRAHPYSRPWAFEGHANQFLAILSMSALPLDHQFQTSEGPITIADMVRHAQKTISSKDEPTWTLWSLSRYLPPDATWRNTQGESWSIERLVSIQTAKPLKGTACGGTHGMFALAHARNVYLRSGKPLRGVWLEAEYKIRRQINTARVQQNSNGMLSSNYFRGREYKRDFNKRMASAGHLLEFLMISLPQDELQQRWVRRAIRATAQDLLRNRKAEVRCSPLYHAVNALNIYLDRVKPQQPTQIAENADDDSDLKPVDDRTSTALKSVPATRISDGKPLMAEADSSAAETADAVNAKEQAGPAEETAEATEPLITAAAPKTSVTDVEAAATPEGETDETAPLIVPAPKADDETNESSDAETAASAEAETVAETTPPEAAQADAAATANAKPSPEAPLESQPAEADSSDEDDAAVEESDESEPASESESTE